MLPDRTDVLIVGAGPTGLALAAKLAKEGVDFVALDQQSEGDNTSRAAVIHARTLEMLEDIGAVQQLVLNGHKVPRFAVRDRDQVLLTIRFDGLPTRYPYTLMIPQDRTESILLERLRWLGGRVHRPYRVLDLEQQDDGVDVAVSIGPNGTRHVRARYVVGADGMHSSVRERVGIGFAGGTYEQSFVLADVRMVDSLDHDEVRLFFSPEGLVVIAPLPDRQHRIVATVERAPETPSAADIQRLLHARGPAHGPAEVAEMIWSSRFRVHHRIADSFRVRRVLLAGDAAHVHSPAGGQGMNIGLREACALGEVLHAVLSGARDETAFDDYEKVHRSIAQRVIRLTDRLTRIATIRGRGTRRLRNALVGGSTTSPRSSAPLPWSSPV